MRNYHSPHVSLFCFNEGEESHSDVCVNYSFKMSDVSRKYKAAIHLKSALIELRAKLLQCKSK